MKTPRQKRCNNPKITDIQLANLKKRRPGWDGWEILLEVRGKQSLAIPMTAHGDLLPREGDTESFTNTKNKTNNNESKCEGLLTRTKQQYSHRRERRVRRQTESRNSYDRTRGFTTL